MDALPTGILTGLSLIVAIGAQNAFVLRQGVRRERVLLVVVLCAGCDLLLILAGVAGVGTLAEQLPWVLEALRWGGAAYLAWFALASFRSALRPGALRASGATSGGRAVARTTLALTLLNPHVYLDTVVMLGSIANQQGAQDRWWFAAGACLGSIMWFSAIGFGATVASRCLARPAVWRVLDVVIGVVMLGLAIRLSLG